MQMACGNEGSEPFKRFEWHSRFRDSRELVEDDERGGRPKSTGIEVNIAADLVENGRQITSRMLAETLNIPKTVVLGILKQDFCSKDRDYTQNNTESTTLQVISGVVDMTMFYGRHNRWWC
jgi:hypothetical protein